MAATVSLKKTSCQNSLVDHANFSFFMGKRISNKGLKTYAKYYTKGGVTLQLFDLFRISIVFQKRKRKFCSSEMHRKSTNVTSGKKMLKKVNFEFQCHKFII